MKYKYKFTGYLDNNIDSGGGEYLYFHTTPDLVHSAYIAFDRKDINKSRFKYLLTKFKAGNHLTVYFKTNKSISQFIISDIEKDAYDTSIYFSNTINEEDVPNFKIMGIEETT